jgi:hypothetical protein
MLFFRRFYTLQCIESFNKYASIYVSSFFKLTVRSLISVNNASLLIVFKLRFIFLMDRKFIIPIKYDYLNCESYFKLIFIGYFLLLLCIRIAANFETKIFFRDCPKNIFFLVNNMSKGPIIYLTLIRDKNLFFLYNACNS